MTDQRGGRGHRAVVGTRARPVYAERPDLVSICLPNEGHFEPTLKVIRAGFPLLVEKPLVFDLDEADVLLREAEARSLFFAINFNHRCVWQAGYFNDADRGFHQTFDKHLDELLSAFRNKQAPPVHARAGRRALALAYAIIHSFEAGTRVDVPPDADTSGR